MTQETGPIYGIPLIEFLPMGETAQHQMPSREDIQKCRWSHHRLAEGYEVLLAHYHQVCKERDLLKRLLSKVQLTQALEHIEAEGLRE